MATKAQQALSANLASLSYALELAGKVDDAPLEVRVGSGRRPGPLERRRQDPDIASADVMSLEFEPGKPFKNFGRLLAHEAGIPLPYNMRQSAEAAEQARLDYENENTFVGEMGDTFLEQMEENALHAADAWGTRMYEQYAAQGRNALAAFFAQDASPEQRAAAYTTLTQLDREARAERNKDATDSAATGRKFLTAELGTSRGGIISHDLIENDRVSSTEAELARLDNVPRGSAEEKIALRTILGNVAERSQNSLALAARGVGSVAGAVPNPYALAAGAGLQAIGAVLENESVQLDRDTVVKMVLEQNDALNTLGGQLREQLVSSHEQLAAEAKPYGVPGVSWSAPKHERPTPYTDAWRTRLFPEGGSRTPDAPEAPPPESEVRDANTADYLRRRADRIDERANRRPTR